MAMKIFLYFVFLCSASVLGFLAQDGSTGSVSGSADDRTILLNLILNEQNSRIQLQNLVTTLSKKLNEMNARVVQMERFNAEVSIKLEKEKNNREHLEQMYAALEQRLNNSTASDRTGNEAVGFSVYNPYNSSGSGSSVFKYQTPIYNSGNGYNMTSGVFTCLHPGLYFFTATSYRSPTLWASYCYFYVNSKEVNLVTSGYGTQTAYMSGTQSIVIKLKAGDRVYLSNCGGNDHIVSYSSFSGFLISS